MKNSLKLLPGDSIEALVAAFNRGMSAWTDDAAPMLARLCANDPETFAKVKARQPMLSDGFLTKMLKVGEGSLHPSLLVDTSMASYRLMSVPVTVQNAVLKTGTLDVVVNPETGDTLRMPLKNLTTEQAMQVISPTGVRTKDEQRAWLKQRSVAAKPTVHSTGRSIKWKVDGDNIVITKPAAMVIDRATLELMYRNIVVRRAT